MCFCSFHFLFFSQAFTSFATVWRQFRLQSMRSFKLNSEQVCKVSGKARRSVRDQCRPTAAWGAHILNAADSWEKVRDIATNLGLNSSGPNTTTPNEGCQKLCIRASTLVERLSDCHLWTWRSLELFAGALVESYSIEPAILSTLFNFSCPSFYFYFIFPFRVECLWNLCNGSKDLLSRAQRGANPCLLEGFHRQKCRRRGFATSSSALAQTMQA